jgi:hypothetical protein
MLDFRSEFRERRKIRTRWLFAFGAATLIVVTSFIYFARFRTQRNISPQMAVDRQVQQQPVKSIVLTANLLRGVKGSQPNALIIPTAPTNIQLLLSIESDVYPRYSAVLQTVGGKMVANLNGLDSVAIETGRAVSIHVSSQLFGSGNYIVILRGERPNGETQIVNLYELVVK